MSLNTTLQLEPRASPQRRGINEERDQCRHLASKSLAAFALFLSILNSLELAKGVATVTPSSWVDSIEHDTIGDHREIHC
jgi:hypothetical protein